VPQIFRPRANDFARWFLWIAPIGLVLVLAAPFVAARSDYLTGIGFAPAQPVPFSHAHHAGDLRIDCRYCHTGVETSANPGMPATEVCMTCHSQIWTKAPMLAPVRASLAEDRPLTWQRVTDLAGFVLFNHAIHVRKGVACVTCHGPVGDMPLTRLAHPMQMQWCLGCHRDPAPNLVPPADVFDPDADPARELASLHAVLMGKGRIDPARLTDCYVCHR
jgi:hypothetical protein